MRIAYINSEGKAFEFLNNKNIKIKDADFYKYSYGYEGTELTFGVNVERFKKGPSTYPVELLFYGSSKNRSKQIADLHEAVAVDRINKEPGKLIYGDWYIKCYVIEGDTYPYENQPNITVKETSLFCPYPFWIREKSFEFLPKNTDQTADGLDFPTDFPFDFTPEQSGIEVREVEHFDSSNFLMRYYGPCENPSVSINGYPYRIFTTLEANEYLEIDSRKNSVTKFMANGETSDLYNSRSFKQSVFEKIPSGRLVINWTGTFGIDLTLYLERSVPKKW